MWHEDYVDDDSDETLADDVMADIAAVIRWLLTGLGLAAVIAVVRCVAP